MRILAVIAGAVLILTGILCFANRGEVFLSIAFLLGCVMVFAGAAGILIYFFAPGKQSGFGWFLVEGLITLVLGWIVLSDQLSTDAMAPPFFGMWILYSGVMRVVASLNLKQLRDNSWILTLALGIISAGAGAYAFFNQVALGLSVVILTGMLFLIQGVNVLAYGVFIPKKKKMKRHGRNKNR